MGMFFRGLVGKNEHDGWLERDEYSNEHGVFLPIDDGKLHVHHIVPVAFGGGDEPSNLIALCVDCHLKRHKKKGRTL